MPTYVMHNDLDDAAAPADTANAASATKITDRRASLAAVVRLHPLAAFVVLAFAITWAPTPFGVFMAAGPLLSALIVTAIVDGRPGLRALGSRMLRWRVGWPWYAAALTIPLTVVLGTGALTAALGAPDAPLRELSLSSLVLVFGLRLVVPVFSPIGEEPGWRGFALPRVLRSRSPLEASLLLGLIVAVWHVPLIFLSGENLPPIFLLATVAVTVFYSWLFVHTGGSVFITILAHAAEGTIGREFTGPNGFVGSDQTHWTLYYTAGWCTVAIALLVCDRRFRRRAPGTRCAEPASTAPRRAVLPRLAGVGSP